MHGVHVEVNVAEGHAPEGLVPELAVQVQEAQVLEYVGRVQEAPMHVNAVSVQVGSAHV